MDTQPLEIEWLDSIRAGTGIGTKAERTLLRAMLESPGSCVENARTVCRALRLNGFLIPVTINDGEAGSSYVCSPWNNYVNHAREQLRSGGQSHLTPVLEAMLSNSGAWLREGQIDRVVTVMNWMLPTNLYPEWHGEGVRQLTESIRQNYPDHAIVFRSLNEVLNARLMVALRTAGYGMLPNRPVRLIRENGEDRSPRSGITEGLPASHRDISPDDFADIVQLHREHDMRLSSPHLPAFTEDWLRICHQTRFLRMMGVRGQDGTLNAVAGTLERSGALVLPIVAARGAAARVQLSEMLLDLAAKKNLTLCTSAGIAEFSAERTNVREAVEYQAVYHAHLPRERRLRWETMEFLLTRVGLPLVRRFRR